jgi:hypothetical protein
VAFNIKTPGSQNCDSDQKWERAKTFKQYIKKLNSYNRSTGQANIEFLKKSLEFSMCSTLFKTLKRLMLKTLSTSARA